SVTGHIPIGMTAYDGVNDGMDQINHLSYIVALLQPKDFDAQKATFPERLQMLSSIDVNSEAGKQAMQFLKEHGTVIDPTMALYDMRFRPADQPAAAIEPGVAKVAPELREPLMNGGIAPNFGPASRKVRQRYLEVIGALHRAGVTIVAGTDQTVP